MKTTPLLAVILFAACTPTSSLETSSPRSALGGASQQLAYVMRTEYQAQAMRVEPPLGLTPSDGSELGLVSLVATVTIDGPIAHTELHFTFKNTENRQREGRFKIELPDGAAVSRFAMLIGKDWRESRVVARDQGRQVYESFLHQKVDPALLEQDLGNQFSARVFPIAASSDKELVIGYDHAVSAVSPYTLALRGLPAIPKLQIAIERDGERTVTERRDVIPEDVVVAIAAGDAAVAGGGAFVARIDAPASTAPAALDNTLFLVDTSASRHTVMGRQADLVQKLVASLGEVEVAVAAYDQTVTELYRGPAGSADLANKLYEHGALGASNLGAALARASASGMKRIVIVGDGVITQGETGADKLVAAIREAGIDRVDAIQIGGSLSRETLAPLTAAGRSPGAILDGRDAAALASALGHAIPPEQKIHVAGATEVWPKTTRGAMPGRPLFVTGRGSPRSIQIGERVVAVAPRTVEAQRVARAAGRAEVGELGERLAITRDDKQRMAIEHQIEQVALAHNLVSSKTSLLVLESEADEQRMLGTPTTPRSSQPERSGGEVIRIRDSAPTIDPTTTTQGITIDRNYLRNVPVPGRTFASALGSAAGSQADGRGVVFSGATSLENQYYVDGINATGVATDTMSPLGLDHIASYLKTNAFVFGLPRQRPRQETTARPPAIQFDSPYTDRLALVMTALAQNQRKEALAEAARWQTKQPGELAALIGLGEALEASGATTAAARAYGSIIDLYPNRFELLRAAGERFDRLGQRDLAIDAYRRSLKERPDQLSTSRLLAFALFRAGRADEALARLQEARTKANPSLREVLRMDSLVIAAAIAKRDPSRRAALETQLGDKLLTKPTLHLVLSWETDANDVDLHVVDRTGEHAFYSHPTLTSGGKLLEDLTDGYGPEMFTIHQPAAFPYQVAVHYFNRGPQGLGIGTVQVIRHDGKGNVTVDDRPFVLQKDGVTIPLGTIER